MKLFFGKHTLRLRKLYWRFNFTVPIEREEFQISFHYKVLKLCSKSFRDYRARLSFKIPFLLYFANNYPSAIPKIKSVTFCSGLFCYYMCFGRKDKAVFI